MSLSPATLNSSPAHSEQRCCFCYGLFEESVCVLADQRVCHKECLSPLLKALGEPSLVLKHPDGTEEPIPGAQALHPWPI
ncbi:hypothetical protein COW36_13160 [bacterium (Candidatus Blackallbacteria) CG17_big_fil_post_rev_8_21_14_2_50_48_46]|uniref:Uncharacterized protein n=1 Tax=bacterium (Candidatus Blackallbacteria) CG17_big_fil_post_rev_8_21_14_2_50_48_46 TaxID=2014261 RepID=A0A2M7G493_9BACT|nr:MAG: hypothetical protein COW64_02110 [bacterium (Candidatus Blackallbacteria) CG18_big_fil_WC_8_21_14_2_50_49_26]PIW16708.1 MAG: hypothetical protein COW36_13160 [bacterium (Candidatus Blackallbacteria) CG17_big_fil_post_rev_8_21_14_2_50_48_46]PIW46214.1 MAG: hypothetical protein COW20_18410 [bacterium (Candidatus Blackallbacteria) CG13_big_fil_rev_8_21_14_2_50_49_14]